MCNKQPVQSFWFIFVLPERKPDGRKQHPYFFRLILQKSKDLFLFWTCTNKRNLLQFRLLWLKGVVASTLRRKKKIKWSLQRCMHTQLSILPWNAACSFIIIKNNQSKYGKKPHCSVKYVVKSVPLSIITVPPWSYAKHLVLHGYWNASEVGLHKG